MSELTTDTQMVAVYASHRAVRCRKGSNAIALQNSTLANNRKRQFQDTRQSLRKELKQLHLRLQRAKSALSNPLPRHTSC